MGSNPSRPRRFEALLLGLLVGGWLAGFGFLVARLHAKALDEGLRTATSQARNFEEQLTQSLQVIELTAAQLEPRISPDARSGGMTEVAQAALRSGPYLRSLSLLDAQGQVLASTTAHNVGQKIDLQAFFPSTQDSAPVLRIGAPRPGRDLFDGGTPADAARQLAPNELNVIPVLGRVPGQPERWMLAAVNPDYFINHYSQLLDVREGRVHWLRYDGLLLASSGPEDAPGAKGVDGSVMQHLAQREIGHFEQALGDGREVLSAYRASSRFPAVIAVHVDREQVLSPWKSETRGMAAVLLPALGAFSAAGMVAMRRQRRIAEQGAELRRQTVLSASVFEATSDAIVLTSPKVEIISCNTAFLQLSGYARDEVLGRNPNLVASGEHDREFYQRMWAAIRQDGHWQGELVNRRKDGGLYIGLVSINAVHNEAGELQHYVGVTHDITERKRAQAAERETALRLQKELVEKMLLVEQALRDGLTGLFNRRYLDETLPREIARAMREGYPLTLIMVDIDHFKKINDTFGHPAGDAVIRRLGRILQDGTRKGDIACRYGGEEFVVALPGMDLDAALARAEAWRLAAASQSVRHGDLEIRFTLSAGVAAYPNHGADADTLVQCADLALYRSKEEGRNRVLRFALPA